MKLFIRKRNSQAEPEAGSAESPVNEGLDGNGKIKKGYKWKNSEVVRAGNWSEYYG